MNGDMFVLFVFENLRKDSIGFILGRPHRIPVFDGMIFACLLSKGDDLCPIGGRREGIRSRRFTPHLFVRPDYPADVILVSLIDMRN